MPMTKQEAFVSASQRLGASASVDTIIREADKILNYINGTTGASCAAAAPKPPAPVLRKKPATYFKVEYKNRNDSGTHLGAKTYKTYDAAYKNRRIGRVNNVARRSRADRFVKVVKFTENTY